MNGIRRKILIVEDNQINRDLLASLLRDEFDLLFASNGQEGMEILARQYLNISLVLLDVYMPVCNGFEFLKTVGYDSHLAAVPIIVTTASDHPEDEVRCLNMGALDFITKPFNPEVVLARVHSVIKLTEAVTALSIVEFDALTGLYTMPAFYHHASQVLQMAGEESYDLAVSDLKDFKLINSILGEKKGDDILKQIALELKQWMPEAILSRQGDKFFALYPSKLTFSRETAIEASDDFRKKSPTPDLITKYAVYKNVDKSLPVSILCDRTIMALSSIKEDSSRFYTEYDAAMESRLLKERNMELRFDDALKQEEFQIWFQPKIDTRSGKIVGAEALVRWFTPEDGLLSPSSFIPFFERNGMIARLDQYVFRKVCQFQKKRFQKNLLVVPVSANLSRNSIYQPEIIAGYIKTIEDTGITRTLVPIELTESAAMEGAKVHELTSLFIQNGFSLHIDDFGTGYSSFSGLASTSFDVIKIDKSLIDHIGSVKGNTLIRHIVNIAQEIGMKVVAEGVETKLQLDFLKHIGCDQIQGYYYSPPIKETDFERMLNEQADSITCDLIYSYNELNEISRGEFDIDGSFLSMLKYITEDMLEGFFIYRANSDETILYANEKLIRIYGCDSISDFRKLTGNSFRGMVHPSEYVQIEQSIFRQIRENSDKKDFVEYHIVRKNGSVGYVKDRGHLVHSDEYGNLFYVFISEIENPL